jgi:hypothetical protein
MDQIKAFYEEHKVLIVSVLHVFVIIPLIFLAIRPEYIPLAVPINVVMYIVYALLAVGVISHGYRLGVHVQKMIQAKQVTFSEPVVQEEPSVQQ